MKTLLDLEWHNLTRNQIHAIIKKHNIKAEKNCIKGRQRFCFSDEELKKLQKLVKKDSINRSFKRKVDDNIGENKKKKTIKRKCRNSFCNNVFITEVDRLGVPYKTMCESCQKIANQMRGSYCKKIV